MEDIKEFILTILAILIMIIVDILLFPIYLISKIADILSELLF